MNHQELSNELNRINAANARSAWARGVGDYAINLLSDLSDYQLAHIASASELEEYLLNGARSWLDYSYGGCALIYDADIAVRLCCPSELKRTRCGELNPNTRESWLEVQARALHQAANRIKRAYSHLINKA